MKLIDDPLWLKQKYIDEKMGSSAIAKLCNTTHHTVMSRIRKFRIPLQPITHFTINISKSLIEEHYLNKRLSIKETAIALNVDNATLRYYLKKYKIRTRSISEGVKIIDDKLSFDYLLEHYVNQKKPCSQISKEIGVGKSTVLARLHEYGIKTRTFRDYTKFVSDGERQLREFVSSLTNNIITNDYSLLKNFELDIVLPDHKIALEFNGQYYHTDNRVGENFHRIKSERCHRIGYHLVHVWEWIWNENEEWYKNVIKDIIGESDLKKYIINNELDFSIFPRIPGYIMIKPDAVWAKGKSISTVPCDGYHKLTKCGLGIYT